MLTLVTAILATYGISKLLTSYSGPYELFSSLRQKYPLSPLSCLICTSTWLAAPIAIISGLSIIEYLAILGVIILVENKL